ncbi:GrpB family protein [Dyadobacter alkalitolerans]|uniref:GrpB family protein n=1 Tax=Dyadobacter alkalitolerans TaxID=492736 RepID=UPI000411C781|nr:GrpB family protein [Dyadobacter alkalitolerans]
MIQIVRYQPGWPLQFQQIATLIKDALSAWPMSIYHIGSTAVPGLAAKEIVDIQISVNAFELQMEKELIQIGFTRITNLLDHRPPGRDDLEDEDLYKWFFKLDGPAVNLHVRKRGMFNERYPLLCRDYLRTHPHAAKAYEAIKLSLAHHFPNDLFAYYEIKDPVFDVLMAGAEIWASAVNWSNPPSDI